MSKAEKNHLGKRILLALSLCFVTLMTYLGFWQLDRAEQKEEILQKWHSPAIAIGKLDFKGDAGHINEIDQHKLFYSKVALKGKIDSQRYFLLDNRTRDSKVGYEVITALTLSKQEKRQVVFVNLGWIAASTDRNILPVVDLPSGELNITGWLKEASESLLLAEDKWRVNWPVRIQQVKLKKMAAAMEIEAFYPLLLLAEKPLLPQLKTQWQPTNMTVAKHLGYSAQWFLMAFALVLMTAWFFVSSYRKAAEKAEV